MDSAHEQRWLTIDEVADRLRCSPRTVQRLIARGAFDPVMRPSKHSVRIAVLRLEDFEREHTGAAPERSTDAG